MKSTIAAICLLLAFVAPSVVLADEGGYNQYGQPSQGGQYDQWGNWCGDPQFIGLDGRMFFFDGVADKDFNIISEKDLQLNAHFVKGPHNIAHNGVVSEGTYIQAIGIKAYDTSVEVAVNELGNLTVVVDGLLVGEDHVTQDNDFSKTIEKGDGVAIMVEAFRKGTGHTVTVQTPLVTMAFYPTVAGYDEGLKQNVRGHLNMMMRMDAAVLATVDMHGVLGQTTPDKAPNSATLPEELQTEFLGEGVPSDYMVSGLFADDFKYNRFGAQSSKDLTASSGDSKLQLPSAARRSLREGAAKVTEFGVKWNF